MLLPRKWALSLGLLAAAPALALGGPLDQPQSGAAPQPAAATADADATKAAKAQNQQIAEAIAKALGKEKLVHKNVQIEVNGGVAKISGDIKNAEQRATVSRVVQTVAGVQKVDNQLRPMDAAAAAPSFVQQAAAEMPAGGPRQIQRVNNEVAAPTSNQEVAQNVADALTAAGLSGYDIEVRYINGAVSLIGSVEDQAQVAMAYRAASSVPGVNQVVNKLSSARGGAPIQPAGYPGMAPQFPQQMPPQMAMAPQGYPIQQAQGMMVPGQMAPAPMGAPPMQHVQPAGHLLHNQPNVPDYAWPSYAPYDNSAAITYPGAYDASAWPYIGPYYPYPQVPLGWRESKLVWKDGNWNLQFESRTDRWWWFLHPKNWD